jgi:hypothetical protein
MKQAFDADNNMEVMYLRKWLSLLFSATLVFGIGTSAVAGTQTTNNKAKADAIVEKANNEILDIIEKGVLDSAELQQKYLAEVAELNAKPQPNDQIVEQVKTYLYEKYGTFLDANGDVNFEIQEDEGTADNEILAAVENIVELVDVENFNVATLATNSNEVDHKKLEKVTEKYVKELSKTIAKVYDDTKNVSLKSIKEISKLNHEAKRYWVPVMFNGITVQIDPIQIVGEL